MLQYEEEADGAFEQLMNEPVWKHHLKLETSCNFCVDQGSQSPSGDFFWIIVNITFS